ncbi:crossover junction endodeoxyribonuclease RuvC [Bacillus subtilis]|uniref:crossover junction endodeoxyribonuclease RuvC n=1 Tax=Bacillus subtilis TaxID=1423 RepID=UPI000A10E597|nr:crossover junction endodeoxyribonuclease RuvC [Bacillus subtilis]MCY8194071.1 crossover junction endodeoxyribonuclease RuvC [Bacillus spizizenii]MCY8219401.1 crossover junction endodeoxyribonuclease RuvC [Bacillus spizizenii]MCY8362125.1 crossover junction endodeoxyribonuclease RuvC [Bacillus spizizenii]MCY8368683.1 crossover junction endodeoxyribonuclease RuvC [Bacillus spizizenii]MEC4031895.1 crossover junction endodeoxyribonuclease RuvC [Bacillus subtilis]
MANKKKQPPSIDTQKNYRFMVGFDPSLSGTGYAVLDTFYKMPRIAEMGVVKGRTKTWPAGTPYQIKLALIQAKAKELRAKYDPIFPIVFLERGHTGPFNNDTQAVFRARGALESELVGNYIQEYPPSQVKKAITGNGSAEKEEVAEHLAEIFGISLDHFETFDVSDALGVVYTGYLEHVKKGDK